MGVTFNGSGIVIDKFENDIVRLNTRIGWEVTKMVIFHIKKGKGAIRNYSIWAEKWRKKYSLRTDLMNFTTNESARASINGADNYSSGKEMLRFDPMDNMTIKSTVNNVTAMFIEESAGTKWEANTERMKSIPQILNDIDFQRIVNRITNRAIREGLFNKEGNA